MSFKSDTFRRPDGRWVFVATEGDKYFEYTHEGKWTPFTEEQLHAMKLEAMALFDGGTEAVKRAYDVNQNLNAPSLYDRPGPVEEPGRPRVPVTDEIAGSNPAGTAKTYEWCSKHNLRTPCPVCADRAVIWDLVALLGGFDSLAMQNYAKRASTTQQDRDALARVRRGL